MIHKPFAHSKQHERRTPVHTHIVSTFFFAIFFVSISFHFFEFFTVSLIFFFFNFRIFSSCFIFLIFLFFFKLGGRGKTQTLNLFVVREEVTTSLPPLSPPLPPPLSPKPQTSLGFQKGVTTPPTLQGVSVKRLRSWIGLRTCTINRSPESDIQRVAAKELGRHGKLQHAAPW